MAPPTTKFGAQKGVCPPGEPLADIGREGAWKSNGSPGRGGQPESHYIQCLRAPQKISRHPRRRKSLFLHVFILGSETEPFLEKPPEKNSQTT